MHLFPIPDYSFSVYHRNWKQENYNSKIGSRVLNVISLLSTRYSCVRTGKWNKNGNHFLISLTAADRCMGGSRHEALLYQTSTLVQQGSCPSMEMSCGFPT